MSDTKADKNAGCLRKLEKIISRLEPQTIVLEAFEPSSAKRSTRIVRLCRSVVALAQSRGMEVVVYTKGEIRSCFASVGARTRQEVAEAIVRSFEPLRDQLPRPRRDWEGPPRRMALFDAGAAVIAHYHLGASRLFESLSTDDPTK
ncbi:hypothetical protein [Sphingosinicella ginsenosidimutans]|uniref:Uncharacterized protein n=1 Tax=Allosphingosinicella ginsenosidimutans TaxID=1176539 RepID=A0A5C6TWB2_9SPHN|nr:hypothetical protein [Sphingosinicella ginsenosidimutans]TXC64672.1 hypothetical protein FRZ32_14065 [Sphingosinicella ginsenosidimutans]